jgi:acetyltransferase-like isoleucine patch superfamily enzyme
VNLHVLLRRLCGKPTLVKGKGTSIRRCARILNAGDNSDRIRVGRSCRIEGELFVFPHGGRISIGDWCFVGPGARLWSALDLSIGDRVLISHNVNVMDSLTHPLDPTERHTQFRKILSVGHPRSIDLDEKPVRIEDDAWVGAGAIVLRGVTIGRCAVVGAGAVVTRDVPPYAVVVGNPARVVRRLSEGSVKA